MFKNIEHGYFDEIVKTIANVSGMNNCPKNISLTTDKTSLSCDVSNQLKCTNVGINNYYCKCPTDASLVIDRSTLSCDIKDQISCSNSGVENYYCK